LKDETQADRQKIKLIWPKNSGAQSHSRPHNRSEKTDCRNDEKISIHRKSIV
jgi:hypothetical protein